MIVLGVDPGPTTCGMVAYCSERERVLVAHKGIPVERLLEAMADPGLCDVVALERVQSYGISNPNLYQTAEVMGKLWYAAELNNYPVELYYRRQVLRALDVTGRGNRDSLVRQRILEIHGGNKQVAIGKKSKPGPCYGVAGDAWAALAVALTYLEENRNSEK